MNILVIDDNKFIRDIVGSMIRESGHHPIVADGHKLALQYINEERVDLVLMDIEMPGMNGFELTKEIRKSHVEWIPIIFLSSNDSEEYLSKGIDVGGDDYLTKPVKQVILTAKIRAMERIAHMKEQLDKANRKLARLTSIDPLTQVLNRRGLDDMLSKSINSNDRHNGELSILMVDIDYFKPYNDNYGHPVGDKCLKQMAQIMKKCLNRSTDFIARYGGEEFVIALPFTPIDGARFKAKEILKSVELAAIPHEHSPIRHYVTVSIGIATTASNGMSSKQIIESADQALYLAKEKGRNQYQVFQQHDVKSC